MITDSLHTSLVSRVSSGVLFMPITSELCAHLITNHHNTGEAHTRHGHRHSSPPNLSLTIFTLLLLLWAAVPVRKGGDCGAHACATMKEGKKGHPCGGWLYSRNNGRCYRYCTATRHFACLFFRARVYACVGAGRERARERASEREACVQSIASEPGRQGQRVGNVSSHVGASITETWECV